MILLVLVLFNRILRYQLHEISQILVFLTTSLKKVDKARMLNKISRMPDWSDLPGELLGLISLRLSFFDMLSFIWVCSSWRVAAKSINKGKSFPLLVFFTDALQPRGRIKFQADDKVSFLGINEEKKLNGLRKKKRCRNPCQSQIGDVSLFNVKEVSPSTLRRTQIFNQHVSDIGNNVCFFSIKDMKAYTLRNTQNLCNILNNMVGSHPDGWLVMSDENHEPYLLNLLPQIRRVQLPSILLLPSGELIRDFRGFRKSVMSVSNPTNHQDDSLMVMMLYGSHKLAFWRHGANEWVGLDGEDYSDVAFCNNTLYALQIEGRFDVVSVEAWEFSTIRSFLPEKKFSFEVSCMSGCMTEEDCYYHATKLVVSPVNGDILVLAYGGTYRDDPCSKWSVFKVDLNEERCIQVDSLNGQALFLDRTSSKFLSLNDVEHHGCKPNSIYYINWWEATGDIKLRNYGIEDAEIRHIWDTPATLEVGSSWIAPTI